MKTRWIFQDCFRTFINSWTAEIVKIPTHPTQRCQRAAFPYHSLSGTLCTARYFPKNTYLYARISSYKNIRIILFVIQHHLQDLIRNKSLNSSKHIQQPHWIGTKNPSDISTQACIPSRQKQTNLNGNYVCLKRKTA